MAKQKKKSSHKRRGHRSAGRMDPKKIAVVLAAGVAGYAAANFGERTLRPMLPASISTYGKILFGGGLAVGALMLIKNREYAIPLAAGAAVVAAYGLSTAVPQLTVVRDALTMAGDDMISIPLNPTDIRRIGQTLQGHPGDPLAGDTGDPLGGDEIAGLQAEVY